MYPHSSISRGACVAEYGASEPVETQIYATGPEPLEETLAEMRKEELRIAWDHARMLGADGSMAAWRWVRSRVRRG